MLFIGVAGGTGSGKTTLAKSLCNQLGEDTAVLIPYDSYYKHLPHLTFQERSRLNYDHPDAFETELLVSHLKALRAGKAIEMPTYDFTTHLRTVQTISIGPRPVTIVEGILVLAEASLRELLDIKVYVDTDADVRVLRRMLRDIAERGRTLESVCEQYLETVKPMHDAFVEPSKRYADIIIPRGGHNAVALGILSSRINEFLAEAEAATTEES
ncbi:MAG: uridine kinase [Firmicutes bacterium]|nr:uridine kinase [Bacillota bacterium]